MALPWVVVNPVGSFKIQGASRGLGAQQARRALSGVSTCPAEWSAWADSLLAWLGTIMLEGAAAVGVAPLLTGRVAVGASTAVLLTGNVVDAHRVLQAWQARPAALQ